MNLDIRKLSLFFVLFDSLLIGSDLPASVLVAAGVIILFSFFIKQKTIRLFFKLIFLISSLFLLKFLFKPLIVTEAGVALVLLLASLKLWELDSENDHFNMFLILALLESCLFLLSPTFLSFFFGVFKIIVFFYFILKIRNYDLSLLSGKRLLFLVAPSLLLSLILFYTFPRFTQGFLNPSNTQLIFSGADSQLNFKKLGPLNLSGKVVFRVYDLEPNKFPIPFLYWRESVLWDYFKDEWRTGYINLKAIPEAVLAPKINYKIKLLKEYNEFLPTLDGTSNLLKNNFDYQYYNEGTFRLKGITRNAVLYDVESNTKTPLTSYTFLMERKGLKLKSSLREKISELILKDKYNLNEVEKLNVAIDFFKNRHFEYTLTPPIYNSVEDFILNGKSGYCSHFAASFAYITRAIGLPSRIVSGYQGGEYNPYDKSVTIRELDSHAWVEVYLKNSGWQKFDPTAIVAPGRIALGAAAYFDRVDPFVNLYYLKLSKSLFKFKAINLVSFYIDSLNSSFGNNILNFDKEKQQQVLESFLPKSISIKWLFVLSLCGSMPLFWFFFNWLSSRKVHKNELRYRKFLKRMKSQGLIKEPFETATLFSKRSSLALPEFKPLIEEETSHYINSFYRQ